MFVEWLLFIKLEKNEEKKKNQKSKEDPLLIYSLNESKSERLAE